MKNISIILGRFHQPGHRQSPNEAEWIAWLRDPLSHPAIEAMAEREIADLPFDRGSFGQAVRAEDCRGRA